MYDFVDEYCEENCLDADDWDDLKAADDADRTRDIQLEQRGAPY
jgi:hypothetical protein